MNDTAEIEYHVVIRCPERWSENAANILAARLVATELPQSVYVYVQRLEDGKIVEQTVVYESSEEDE